MVFGPLGASSMTVQVVYIEGGPNHGPAVELVKTELLDGAKQPQAKGTQA